MRTCNHQYQTGKALINIATNGSTTDSTKWKRGDGVYMSKRVRTVSVQKCIHCGESTCTEVYPLRRGVWA